MFFHFLWFLWVLIWLAVTIFLIIKFIGLCDAVERLARNLEALAFDVKAIRERDGATRGDETSNV